MLKTRRIILASGSPRRREILEKTGLRFRVDESGCEEEIIAGLSPRALARSLSRQKAAAIASKHENALIIAADTFIFLEGKVLGKPHNAKEAIRMLKALSGKAHTVITGFTIFDTRSGKTMSRSVETRVHFKRLRQKEIEDYVKSGEPLDKAGGYGIQGLGAALVEKIEGDFLNVVGLPLCALTKGLKEFGVYGRQRCRVRKFNL